MPLHPNFPESPHEIIDPSVRWFPTGEAVQDSKSDKPLLKEDSTELSKAVHGELLPPLVHKIREAVKVWRDANYRGASETSKTLLNWWFNTRHLIEGAAAPISEFQYYIRPTRGTGNHHLPV